MVDVVVLNGDEDLLGAVQDALQASGFSVAARFSQGPAEELAGFIRKHDPRVVVHDLGPPPVERAIQRWRDLCRQPGADRPYVLTTTFDCNLDPHPCMVSCVLLMPATLKDVAAAVRRAAQR